MNDLIHIALSALLMVVFVRIFLLSPLCERVLLRPVADDDNYFVHLLRWLPASLTRSTSSASSGILNKRVLRKKSKVGVEDDDHLITAKILDAKATSLHRDTTMPLK